MWIILTVALVGLVYYYSTKPFKYWTKHGVQQTNPYPLLGDIWGMIFRTESVTEMTKRIYNLIPNTRYIGMYQFTSPVLLIKDPDLIRQIGVKDFESFTDHRPFLSEEADALLGKNLFSLKGKRWRDMRATLSPSFTSSKMRNMFTLMTAQTENFTKYFIKQNKPVIEVDLKDAFTRFTNDVIATTAFGIQVDSLEDQDNEFYLMGKDATNFTDWWKNLKFFGFIFIPAIYKYFKITFLDAEVTQFFMRIVKETIKTREEHNIVRPDMIHLLMEARKGNVKHEESESIDAGFATAEESDIGRAKVNMTLDDVDVTAQALVFFFAGFDSVSSLMCFTSHELATHPEIQSRLRKEIEDTLAKNNGKLDYEALSAMKYMDMVVSEGLRKWPNAVAADRLCTKPYTIQPKYPDESPVHLKVDDLVVVPLIALHYDPKYHPNPDQFDPERFSDENKSKIKPYTYMPFGFGPRSCIGSRFALLETKAILFNLLYHFEIVPSEKSVIPLKISRKDISLGAEGGFWFGLKRISR